MNMVSLCILENLTYVPFDLDTIDPETDDGG